MKKLILFLFVVFALFCLVGCGDDDNSSSSSLTGVDFTSDNYFEKLDYYLAIVAEEEASGILIFSKKEVTSAQLTINNTNIPIPEEWMYDEDDEEEFPYFIVVGQWILPESIIIQPGAVLNIKLKLNGTNFNNIMTVAHTPIVVEKEFDLTEDFTVTWSLEKNPMAQIVTLEGESNYWDEDEDEDDDLYLVKQLAGEPRSHTFSENDYVQFALVGLEWYEYSVSAVNYKNFGKAMFMSLSADYVESGYDDVWKDGKSHKKLHRIVEVLANK